MTFEEFFNKKRIDLTALQAAEPGLFSEFRTHFDEMGEKSFDHTKKYWFNKLRLQYHLAPELKPDKVHLENRLAEQTIVESILDEKIPAPSVGFKPRFKPGMVSKPAETKDIDIPTADVQPAETEQPAEETAAPKPAGFKPRFNMKMAAPKPADVEETKPEEASSNVEPAPSDEPTAAKPAGFKLRFNMKMAAPKPADVEETKLDEAPSNVEPAPTDEPVVSKPAGFKPRFNAKTIKPKPPEE
ncbi:hypothetical protein FFF34_016540 [Inquilinus sp. KBS0705]|nr:hypothetical protein FFF34_016540 [Inquilinus sp. KBS0705]